MATYYIWAEHTAGKGTNHPCRDGVRDDPADTIDLTVEAANQDDAEAIGWKELDEAAEAHEPCPCGHDRLVGSNDWRDSIVMVASRSPYPEYVGDSGD